MKNAQTLKMLKRDIFLSTRNAKYFTNQKWQIISNIIFWKRKRKTTFVSINCIRIRVELNQMYVLRFTGILFLTPKFWISHILTMFYITSTFLFEIKNSDFRSACYLMLFRKHVNHFGEKTPNGFQVIALCLKGDTN